MSDQEQQASIGKIALDHGAALRRRAAISQEIFDLGRDFQELGRLSTNTTVERRVASSLESLLKKNGLELLNRRLEELKEVNDDLDRLRKLGKDAGLALAEV